jgi:DNA-binding NarL/FixJ family response regulator
LPFPPLLKLVPSCITNREIAKKLKISEKTAARHLNNIFNKIDLSSWTGPLLMPTSMACCNGMH